MYISPRTFGTLIVGAAGERRANASGAVPRLLKEGKDDAPFNHYVRCVGRQPCGRGLCPDRLE